MRRRRFLTTVAGALAGAPVVLSRNNTAWAALTAKSSPLAVASHPQASSFAAGSGLFSVDAELVTRMVDGLVLSLTGQSSVAKAWESLFNPATLTTKTKICIKVNFSYGFGETRSDWTRTPCPFGPKAALTDAIITGLTQMLDGTFPVENIVVFDRGLAVFARVADPTMQGYPVYRQPPRKPYDSRGAGRYRLRLVNTDEPDEVPRDTPTFDAAPDFPAHLRAPQRLLAPVAESDFMINVSNAKDHMGAGVTGAMKNLYGCTDNCSGTHGRYANYPESEYPGPSRCVPEFWRRIGEHCPTVLNVLDALVGLHSGGPTTGQTFHRNTVAASRDPVTLDYYLLRIVNEARTADELHPLTTGAGRNEDGHPNATFLTRAAEEHLGALNNDDLREVRLPSAADAMPALQTPQSRLLSDARQAGALRLGVLADSSGRKHAIDSRITDALGNSIRTFSRATTRSSRSLLEWDGKDCSGRAVGPGAYAWEVTVDGRQHTRIVHVG